MSDDKKPKPWWNPDPSDRSKPSYPLDCLMCGNRHGLRAEAAPKACPSCGAREYDDNSNGLSLSVKKGEEKPEPPGGNQLPPTVAGDKSLIAQCLIPGIGVEIRTKGGAKVSNLIVDRVDGDHVLLVGKNFPRFDDEPVSRIVDKSFANAVVIAIDSIEAVKFIGRY